MSVTHSSMKLLLICGLLVNVVVACNVLPPGQLASSTTPAPAGYFGSTTLPVNTWNQWAPGIELRYEQWKDASNNQNTVTIARLDPHHIHVSVGYQPDHPLSLKDWMKQTHALAVIDGGFFDKNYRAVGLLISDGQRYGTSYSGFGGMLSVDDQNSVSLRSLRNQPYNPDNEQLMQATQSSPMLIVAGQRTRFQADASTRRWSVIAQDKQGRLLLIVSPLLAFSLDELADLLVSSDLSLQTAMSLDGGSSTGLYVNGGDQKKVSIDAFTLLPIVIIIK